MVQIHSLQHLRCAALFLVAAAQLGALMHGAGACHESGLCSAGHVRPWAGDLDAPGALLSALEARSYKKEIVMSIFGGTWYEALLQLWASMQRHGMAHMLALAVGDGEAACTNLLKVEPGELLL